MTWSIVARDPATGHLGVAVTSRFFAVGAVVPHIRAGVGAIATQAFVSPLWGVKGLQMLADGLDPQAVIDALVAGDDGHPNRQFHLIAADGRNAAFTGAKCIDWCGHLVAPDVSVAGNMLSGPQVLDATLAAWHGHPGPFADRLLAALQAGEAAGGDKRGRQSASLTIWRDQDYPWLDIRADDHPAPLDELERLYAVAQERYLLVCETMPTRENPHGMLDRSQIDTRIATLDAERAAAGRPSASRAWARD